MIGCKMKILYLGSSSNCVSVLALARWLSIFPVCMLARGREVCVEFVGMVWGFCSVDPFFV